jgi:hypothetical protein
MGGFHTFTHLAQDVPTKEAHQSRPMRFVPQQHPTMTFIGKHLTLPRK